MSKMVYKYHLPIGASRKKLRLRSPPGIPPALLGEDPKGDFCVWFEVDDEHHEVERTFFIIPTGYTVSADCFHQGSAVCGDFVWHLYERLT